MGENSFPSQFAIKIAKMNRLDFFSLIFRNDKLRQRMTELTDTGFSHFPRESAVLSACHASCSVVSTIRASLSHLEMAEVGEDLHRPVPGISV